MCESVEVILMLIPHGHRIEAFAHEFRGGVAKSFLIAGIEKLAGQGFRESELMIELAKQNGSRM
jgi:hypothetical protein